MEHGNHEMRCRYKGSDVCNALIRVDGSSPSGYTHAEGHGWLHWASPESYGMGLAETDRIFRRCIECGLKYPDNEAHILFSGHKFKAARLAADLELLA
jgi:hypothetical protein